MALLRPSLTPVKARFDERVAAEQTILEINRSYADRVGTPVIRTHACELSEDASRATRRVSS